MCKLMIKDNIYIYYNIITYKYNLPHLQRSAAKTQTPEPDMISAHSINDMLQVGDVDQHTALRLFYLGGLGDQHF